ncbi:hypothetical protein NECAME_07654 [Necator americanus]|uniref:Uncharacterized protein n=1 Tax=Necator americanus TaxID=51031 RepID=W2TLG5_NECAM|nr:hypothetical protein NECAME_07654 [Necator americanus]ETN82940.1 hypothetical protein NECAME_07654 [Necator americanus]
MRLLLQYLCACITTINAFSAVQRRSLIPMSLRKKLCEMKADETMCDFEKEPPRFEEKLTDERELDVQTQRPEESQEEENFGENILEVKDDVFGGM